MSTTGLQIFTTIGHKITRVKTSRIFYSAERVKDVRTFSSMNSITDFINNLRVIVRRVDSSSDRCILLRKPFSFMVANPVASKTF